MSTYYRKNILQAASTSNAPDTDTSSSSMSSNLTVESTLSVSPDESRPATVGGDRQPLLEAVGNGGANGQQPKPRSNNTEVHVYVYKNCLDCAETDGKKIIEAVELATLGSSQSGDVGSGGGGGGSGGGGGGGGSGGSDGTGPAVVLKVAPLLRGRPGTDKAKAKKVAQVNILVIRVLNNVKFIYGFFRRLFEKKKLYRLNQGRTNYVLRDP